MFLDDFVKNSVKKQVETKISKKLIIPNNMKDDFEIYRNVIRKLTYKNKKELFNNWDGYDYYVGEYIKEYLSLHNTNKKYPTIDHKMSLYYGFNNNIPPYINGNIENLCITKRTINSSKCSKNIYKNNQ